METDNQGNGHKTENIPDNGAQHEVTPEEVKEGRRTINALNIANAFHRSEGVSSIRYLVDPGETVEGLSMRTRFPRKRTEGVIFGIAAAQIDTQATEFCDPIAKSQLKLTIASLVSDEGIGRNELVDSIIGDAEHRKRNNNPSWGEKFKKAAGLGVDKPQE